MTACHMDHIAIMKRSWRLTDKIRDGRKTVESRWSRTRRAPWGLIKEGETVYFKDSGFPVTLAAGVGRVIQLSDLTPEKVRAVLEEYGGRLGLDPEDLPVLAARFKDCRYCTLVFLVKPRSVAPFDIDKSGFGNMAAWLSVPDITQIKLNPDGRAGKPLKR